PPRPRGVRLGAHRALVLGPPLAPLAGVRRPQPPQAPPQVFFQRRRAGGSAERGWLGRGTWRVNPNSRSHRQPVSGRTRTPHRPAAYRATLGPLHSPPSVGRLLRAANSSARWSAESL